jgi:translation elongation factor EF-1beta
MENVNLLGEPTNVVDLDKIAEEIRNNTGQRNYRAMSHRVPIEFLKELQQFAKAEDVPQAEIVIHGTRVVMRALRRRRQAHPHEVQASSNDVNPLDVNLLGEPTNVVDLDKIIEEIRNDTTPRSYKTGMTHRVPIEFLKELQQLAEEEDISQTQIVIHGTQVAMRALRRCRQAHPLEVQASSVAVA